MIKINEEFQTQNIHMASKEIESQRGFKPKTDMCKDRDGKITADKEGIKEKWVRSFERKILRRIFGPVQDSIRWRIRYNQELDRLIEGQDLVRFIKAQRLRWLGHVERMPEMQMPKRILKGRLDKRRRRGRPRMRWMDSVIADLATMGIGMEDKSSR
jgi:hypothetical protein